MAHNWKIELERILPVQLSIRPFLFDSRNFTTDTLFNCERRERYSAVVAVSKLELARVAAVS